MQVDMLIKQVVFGTINGKNENQKTHKKIDRRPIVDWCSEHIGTLYGLTMDKIKWTHFVKYVIITHQKQQKEITLHVLYT